MTDIGSLKTQLQTQINTVHQLEVSVDIPHIKMEVENIIKQELNIATQGSSF